MFAQYFYVWTPAAVVFATIILISSPFLAMLALFFVSVGAVTALAWAIVRLLRISGRAMRRHDTAHSRRRATAPMPVSRPTYAYAATQKIDYRTPRLGRSGTSLGADGSDQQVLRKRELT